MKHSITAYLLTFPRSRCGVAFVSLGLATLGVPCKAEPYKTATPTQIEREELPAFGRLRQSQQYAALRQLPREKQLRWIDLFRSYDPAIPYYAQSGHDGEFEKLLALNDQETAQWMMRDYQKLPEGNFRWLHPFAEWHTPDGIAFVARQTFSNEQSEDPRPGVVNPAPSFRNAPEILLNVMLPAVVTLPASVRDWAKGTEKARIDVFTSISRGGQSPEAGREGSEYAYNRFREIAQLWWGDNEKAILESRWNDVRPGETFDTPKYRALLAKYRAPQPGNDPARAPFSPNPGSANAEPGSTKDESGTTSAVLLSSHSYLWLSTASVLLAVAGWLILRFMRKKD